MVKICSFLFSMIKDKMLLSIHNAFIVYDSSRSSNMFLWLCCLIPFNSPWYNRLENGGCIQSTSLTTTVTKGLLTLAFFKYRLKFSALIYHFCKMNEALEFRKINVELKIYICIMGQWKISSRHFIFFSIGETIFISSLYILHYTSGHTFP